MLTSPTKAKSIVDPPTKKASKIRSVQDEEKDETKTSQVSPIQSSEELDNPLDASLTRPLDVREENVRLKLELQTLRDELDRLQAATFTSSPSKTRGRSHTRPGAMPESLRQAVETPWRTRRPSPKFRRNSDASDASSIEMHESGRGLHHRKHHKQQAHHHHHSSSTYVDEEEAERLVALDLEDPFHHPAETHRHSHLVIVEPTSFWSSVQDRAGWLVGLLVLQSMSSFIISRNEKLLSSHLVIVQFLTMLVGAGGNAGNQSSVRVIRGLATGSVNDDNLKEFLFHELKMAVTLAGILGMVGSVRAAVFAVPLAETLAITTSLCAIVFISIVLGALLPLAMKYVHIDPAHSSTTIQVLMDILGVTITVYVSGLILDSAFEKWLLGE